MYFIDTHGAGRVCATHLLGSPDLRFFRNLHGALTPSNLEDDLKLMARTTSRKGCSVALPMHRPLTWLTYPFNILPNSGGYTGAWPGVWKVAQDPSGNMSEDAGRQLYIPAHAS